MPGDVATEDEDVCATGADEPDLLAVSAGRIVSEGAFPLEAVITGRDLVAAHQRMRSDLHAAGVYDFQIVPSSERAHLAWETLTLADFDEYAAEQYEAAADRFEELAVEEPAAAEEWRDLARLHRREAAVRVHAAQRAASRHVHVRADRRAGAPRRRRASTRRRARAPTRRSRSADDPEPVAARRRAA
jgi:hypothetical protein